MSLTLEQYRKMPNAAKKALVGELYVDRDETKKVFDLIDEMLEDAKYLKIPSSLLLIGDTGVGKTTILEKYAKQYPSVEIEGIINRPVLMITLVGKSTIIATAKSMLEEMKVSIKGITREADFVKLVRDNLKLLNVKVVFVDEAQHMVEAYGDDSLPKVGDFFKFLTKDTRVPFILSGISSTTEVVKASKQFNLICKKHDLGPYAYKTDKEKLRFRTYLAQVDNLLPFPQRSKLGEPDIALRMFFSTDGNIKMVMLLIMKAAFNAINNDMPYIGMEDLSYGFQKEIMTRRFDLENPFDSYLAA